MQIIAINQLMCAIQSSATWRLWRGSLADPTEWTDLMVLTNVAEKKEKWERVIPLNRLHAGEAGKVRELGGGRGLAARLLALGLAPGAEVKVIQNSGHGPLIIFVKDTRLALGCGEAAKVIVECSERSCVGDGHPR